MYQVKIDITLPIDGCPAAGIEAIKFREERGLPPEPSNKMRVLISRDSDQPLCRSRADLLDENADLVVSTKSGECRIPTLLSMRDNLSSHTLYGAVLPVSVAQALSAELTTGLPLLLDSLADQAQEARESRAIQEEEERRKKAEEQAEKAKEIEALKRECERIEKLDVVFACEVNGNGSIKVYWTTESLSLEKTQGGYDWYYHPGEALAAAESRLSEVIEYRHWVSDHGSDRLKRCMDEGIDCAACYRDERLAKERPGWRWSAKIDGEYNDPRNPSDEAFALLDQARSTLPEDADSQLVYWIGEKTDYRGYAVISEYLDREIVFGGPEE